MSVMRLRKVIGIVGLLMIAATSAWAGNTDTLFVSQPIPDSIWQRMQGKSYKQNCPISRDELRYLCLSYCDRKGRTQQGEMVCNKMIAQDLVDIFRQLWKEGYPIERMQLIDDYDADDQRSMTANNTSCFNYRPISGTKKISKHGRGMAIDVNPLYNPYVRKGCVEPAEGKRWAFRREQRKDIPMKIDSRDLCCRLFLQHGFRWGGNWTNSKDYQHFEK